MVRAEERGDGMSRDRARAEHTKSSVHQKNEIIITGYGETVENCFAHAALSMFGLMADVNDVHTLQIVTFEFEEPSLEKALIAWLNLLLTKAREHKLIFGDFRLKKTGDKWEATVSGEPWREALKREFDIKRATTTIEINKVSHIWEARCLVKI
jgi:SHS2 domain-containing protein